MGTASVSLSWEIQGRPDAPVIVLGHSLGTDRSIWKAQAAAFEKSFRVLRLDLRGHGVSPAPPGPYALEGLASDVLRVADSAGVDRFVYCGVSLGGLLGLFLALRHPARVEALVAANTAARIGSETGWNDRIAAVRASGLGSMQDGVLERWLAPAFRTRDPLTVERLRRAFVATSPDGYAGCCGALATADLREEISAIRVPTLVVAGELDVATTVADAEFVRESIPKSRLAVLKGAAHLSNIDQSEAFNAIVGEFLAERP
jgi:3-oxoadipate enol-lactonase